MSEELRKFTDVDRVIHEPARLMIVTILYAVEKVDFLYLLHETGLTKGNLSAHLSKLENAEYVEIEKTFRGKIPQTLISLTPAGRTAFETYRKQLETIVTRLSEETK
ncbi:MAG: ArsR family transcriptional regulator [Chloroflexi bacterium]|nr:ArsR family transcriptional regulator [Chloroflexota bacterium]